LNISVPKRKVKLSNEQCAMKAMAVYLGKKRLMPKSVSWDSYNVVVSDDYTYYPYWIGLIHTKKDRALPIYPAKEIMYYLVCDAIDESFIVLRNVPELYELTCDDNNVIPAKLKKERLLNEISNEAIKDRINKQFIFGPPQVKVKSAKMIYLPMKKVEITKKNSKEGKAYGVNAFTGEIKNFGKVYV
jgi:hypothetical protein